ncbi:hypothetical protein [Sphingomonas lenta]|uniref:hypothetical protein n=1 Tax=Sphingomonas lenta TaxID=1141887 RepID=UPI001594ED68|nr:hypothetical protein [Sphingomonas lenta]
MLMFKRMATVGGSIVLALAAPASAACTGEFAALAKVAGGDADLLLKEPVVRARLAELMGPELGHLEDSLAVAGPIGLSNCELVVEGNSAHKGGEQNAILSFSLYYGVITVGTRERGQLSIWSTRHKSRKRGNYSHLPAHVRDWLYVAAGGFRSRLKLPANTTMMH